MDGGKIKIQSGPLAFVFYDLHILLLASLENKNNLANEFVIRWSAKQIYSGHFYKSSSFCNLKI